MSFTLFARAHGVEISDLIASDRIRRVPTTDKPRSKNGAYFWDGSRGWVFNWSGEARTQWYEDPNAKPWTDDEKRAWALKRQTAAAEQERRYENAAMRAAVMLRSATPNRHDYLLRKRLPDAQGLVLPSGELLVPMRGLDSNKLQGAQVISWHQLEMKWEKKMIPGMRAKGAVLRLGPPRARETVLCEGYATGLSIELAARQLNLGIAVLVTFSDSNLVHVAPSVKGLAFVYADNDKSGAGERAAIETGLPYCMSETVGNDANDDHQQFGLMAVCRKLMDVRKREVKLYG